MFHITNRFATLLIHEINPRGLDIQRLDLAGQAKSGSGHRGFLSLERGVAIYIFLQGLVTR